MKLIMGLLICLLLGVFTSSAAALTASSGDYLYLGEITATRFLPSVINAGDSVSIAIDILNKGSIVDMLDTNVSLDASNYIEVIPTDGSIGKISPGVTKTVLLRFKVSSDAQPGYYQASIIIDFSREGQKVTQTESVLVPVAVSQNNIGVVMSPNVINPGKRSNLTFSVTNFSSNPISNVLFKWSDSSGYILPLGSDNRKFVSSIASGATADFNYVVVADPNIATGVYPLDVVVSYNDTNSSTQSSEIGIIVGGETDFDVSSDSTSSGQLSFNIANIGSNNASAVVVSIPKQNGLTVSGSDSVVVGNLNKGDYTIATFTVQTSTVDVNAAGFGQGQSRRNTNSSVTPSTSNIPPQGMTIPPQGAGVQSALTQQGGFVVNISYTDTTGERQVVSSNFTLNSRTTSNAFGGLSSQRGSASDNLLITIVALIVVAAVGVGYNKVKAKKPLKKLLVVVAIAIAVPILVLLFAPSGLSQYIISVAFAIGVIVLVFVKCGK